EKSLTCPNHHVEVHFVGWEGIQENVSQEIIFLPKPQTMHLSRTFCQIFPSCGRSEKAVIQSTENE
ncbi:10423_t:CDS:2, partial [Scutellospora calospora]